MKQRILITCEHGGNLIPDEYQEVFSGHKDVLASHRGYDIGALELYRQFAADLSDAAFYSETSRLLVELNRSLHHPNLFSAVTKPLPETAREHIIQNYYNPYRQAVEDKIAYFVKTGYLVKHISVHSFTPVLNGQKRDADIGLLFDPKREGEKQLCQKWKRRLQVLDPDLRIRFNYPYKGTADGFTTYLRKKYNPEEYIGIELEVNQKFPQLDQTSWPKLQQNLLLSLRSVLHQDENKE
ncbi:MAG: N-formylglutamate amidohydrolase [Hymenobacteraceae bacterium]|nr:N-formylglutamate amidohydrolase [Hymenobacteraceae bacterium]MDX5395956.1 N-formylglutamate amidohydrolase [Hymenobacteraceae bacterium]MDX5443668.1 N-formylglutamate amidohydrolase [Hymenobacteraceae bacterium]MDX5512017.1 N-formylglutamate amidohydrolase [Hymenobacteraceae bacterium]